MIKQKSQLFLKKRVTQSKDNLKKPSCAKKHQSSLKLEPNKKSQQKLNAKKSAYFNQKDQKRNAVQKKSARNSQTKQTLLKKNNHEIYRKHIKEQLKVRPVKKNELSQNHVSQILKNIKKNCQKLNHINEHQKRMSKAQLQRSKQNMCKISNQIQNKMQQKKDYYQSYNINQRQSELSDSKWASNFPSKTDRNRFSMKQENEENIQISSKKNDKNFVQLFKIYKKSFDIEHNFIKNKQGSKQRKSTGSLRGLQNKKQQNSRQELTIRNSNYGQTNHQNKPGQILEFEQFVNSKSKQDKKCQFAKIIKIESPKKPIEQSENYHEQLNLLNQQYGNNEQVQNINRKNEINDFSQVEILILSKLSQKENQRSIKNQKIDQIQKNREQSLKFEKSRYYVQQIPKRNFKPEPLNQLSNSLAGCEIPLIQDNFIHDIGDLISLQL